MWGIQTECLSTEKLKMWKQHKHNFFFFQNDNLGVVAYACNPYTWEADTGGLPRYGGNARLPSDCQTSLATVKPCHKQANTPQKFCMWWLVPIVIGVRFRLSWRLSGLQSETVPQKIMGLGREVRSSLCRDRRHITHCCRRPLICSWLLNPEVTTQKLY